MKETEIKTSWRDFVLEEYRGDLKQIVGYPLRWEIHDLDSLWHAIWDLRAAYDFLAYLANRAKEKRKKDLWIRIDQAQECVNLALGQLDPNNWHPKRQRNHFKELTDNPKRLESAAELLQQALMLFSEGYEQISIEVEADRRKWYARTTPFIYRWLRDAVYSITTYLTGQTALRYSTPSTATKNENSPVDQPVANT